uniref:Myb/SANT-like domain-containing protein n=1 Tax=Solanum lycopersicum TaxID=4081 RepID=A0A3Q7IH64_SOLLC
MNNDAYTATIAAVVRAPPKDFKAVREEWAAIRIQTTFRGFFVFPSDFLFFSFILGNLEERHFNSLLVLILISSKLIRRCYKPWQIFLLCPFLCYIINAITLYWSLEQMDMTNKDEDDAIVGAVATSVLAFGVAINVALADIDFFALLFASVVVKESFVLPVMGLDWDKQWAKKERSSLGSQPMEYLMLEILADEVKQGNKSTNQFKVISFNCVSNAINEQLGMECSPKHVENHLKTLRSTWNIVQTLLNNSGLGWDDNLKMITASPRVYAMHIVGDCAKSFEDIGLDYSSEKGNEDEIEGPSKENREQDVSETSQVKSNRKRNRPSDVQDVVGDISTKLGEVAAAISKIAEAD